MRQFLAKTLWVPAAICLGLGFSCADGGGAKSPRLSTIPQQRAAGGTTFTLDLAPFVEDDTQTVSYAVLAGSGSFTGSIYTNQFPTLGTYSVSFRVTDFRGNVATSNFQVKVTSAELAVVRNGTGISLLDLQTGNFAAALQDDGRPKTFRTALRDGSLILEVSDSGQKDLWLFNPNVAGTDVFAGEAGVDEAFGLKTSKDWILYVKGTSPSRTLRLYDPFTKTTAIFGASGQGTRDERNPMINGSDVVFFESAQGGQADIYSYDVTSAQVTAVSTHAADEDLLVVLANGGVVFRRPGGGGEWDLLYYQSGTGVLEIGSDLSAAVNLESKEFKATTQDSQLVFETTDGGGDRDLYVWSSANGQTTAIGATGADERFAGLSASGRLIWHLTSGASNKDLMQYNVAHGTGAAIAATTDDETYHGSLANGDVIYGRNTGANGIDLYIWDESGNTVTVFPDAAATNADQVFAKVLASDDVVYVAGSHLSFFRPSAGTSTSVTTAAGIESLAGEVGGGDFLIGLAVSGNTYLYLWDNTAGNTVPVSTVAGNAAYQAASTTGKILFARTASGATTSELFSFAPATSTTVQITDNARDDSVDAVVQAVVN